MILQGAVHSAVCLAADAVKGKGLHLRSPKWLAAKKVHLLLQPFCQWCFGREKLQVHHVQPFHEHPELELDPNNLITMCEAKDCQCHLHEGHLGNFKNSNPAVKQECQNGVIPSVDAEGKPVPAELRIHLQEALRKNKIAA